MDLASFLHHLDGRGVDLDAWSADTRAGAEALMVQSAPARTAFLAMKDVERLLRADAVRVGARGPGADVLAASAMRRPQVGAAPRTAVSRMAASRIAKPATRAMFAAAAVITLCLGMALGWGQGQQEDGPDRVLAIAFDPTGAVDVD